MANRTYYPSTSAGSSRVYVEFLFALNNTSTPLLTTVDGADIVASFNRTGVGVIVVTLKDTFNKNIAATADIDDTGAGDYATIGNFANEGTATPIQFTIRTRVAAGTLTDFNGRICKVALAFRNGNWGVK
jgi:hypothetical protein